MMLVAGVLLWANLTPRHDAYFDVERKSQRKAQPLATNFITDVYGWPFDAVWIDDVSAAGVVKYQREAPPLIAADALLALALLFALYLICERSSSG